MLKKKYNLNKQLVLKYNENLNFSNKLLTKSFAENQFLNPLIRLSFLVKYDRLINLYNRFSSLQKLQCLISLSNKVPNKSYNYSRFFLNKQLNKLTIANTLK
jgi:hypothetical protein